MTKRGGATIREFTVWVQVLPKHDGDGVQRRGRHVHHFTPKKKADNALAIHTMARANAPHTPWTGPIRLDVHCVRRMPKKWLKIGADRFRDLPHFEGTPDITNQLKQVEDALEGLFYENDRQVACGTRSKSWGVESCVHIRVEAITAEAFKELLRAWKVG